MPRVDFYLLNRHTPDGKLRAACRLCQKIYTLGHTALIQARDLAQAETLDDLMWTFDQSSFVPHALTDETTRPDAPIVIGYLEPTYNQENVLISLLDTVPDYFIQYSRIAEFVDDTVEDKSKARDRFRLYREHGCTLETHDIRI
ncbi:MAG: DNA polymerase III subunit chi [Arenicellales bacterium]|nr:DNA polymerase III subunit chi [Arenicellales bacterium]